MTSQHFKSAAQTLANAASKAGVVLSVYDVLNLTDALIGAGADFTESTPDYSTHDGRVLAALASPEVLNYLRDSKKIHAIKELRLITQCGLKEAKDAVEDARVDVYYYRPAGW